VLRCFLIVCLSCTLLVATARGQAQAVTWPPLSQPSVSSLYIERPGTPLHFRLLDGEPPDTVPRQIKPTHWREGGMVGSLLVGAFSVWFGNEICRYVEDGGNGCAGFMIRGAIAGGITGFLIGALIGGQFPKHPSASAGPT
jgi:hypothetical protein